jgi:hypothetical protein
MKGNEMKKIWFISASLLLAGCSGAEEAEPVAADEMAADQGSVSADPSMWASAEDAAGTYTLAYTDGTEGTLTVMADGSAQGIIGGEDFSASLTIPEPGKLCYSQLSNEELPVPAQCWVNSPANEDGSWNFSGEDGTTGSARPAE